MHGDILAHLRRGQHQKAVEAQAPAGRAAAPAGALRADRDPGKVDAHPGRKARHALRQVGPRRGAEPLQLRFAQDARPLCGPAPRSGAGHGCLEPCRMLLGKGMDIPLRQAQGRAGHDLARRQDLQRQRLPAAADDPQLLHGRTACQTRRASAALPT